MQTVLLILVFHIKFLLQGKYPFIFSFRVEKPRSFCVSVVAMIRHKVFFNKTSWDEKHNKSTEHIWRINMDSDTKTNRKSYFFYETYEKELWLKLRIDV